MTLCCRRFGIDAVRRRIIVYDLAAAQLPCVFFAAGFGLPFGIRWVDGSKVPLRPSPLNPVSPPQPMRVLTRFGHSTADQPRQRPAVCPPWPQRGNPWGSIAVAGAAASQATALADCTLGFAGYHLGYGPHARTRARR